MAETLTPPGIGTEPFVVPSLRGVLSAVRKTAASYPQVLISVFGPLAVVVAATNLLTEMFDTSASIGAIALGMTAGFLIAYVLPRMWSALLGQTVDAGILKAANTKLSVPASGAAAIWALLLSVAIGPIVLLLLFGADLPPIVFIGLFAGLVVVATRVVMASLVLIPMAILREDESASLMKRAWRLSRPAFWPLATVTGAAFAVAIGSVLLGVWMTSNFDLPLWAEDYVVLPLVNALNTGMLVLLSPAAYAVARHCNDGYDTAAADADLQEMLAPAPATENSGRGSWFQRQS